ncbi:MAG: LCP family protein [bacterium]
MRVIFWLVVILLLSISTIVYYRLNMTQENIGKVFKDSFKQVENLENVKQKVINKFGNSKIVFLVLGLDHNWVEGHLPTSEGARSDTIILVTLDLYNQELRLLSIPRDLRVYYKDYGYYDKINAAIVVGGPRLTKRIVSETLSVYIDYIVVIKQKAIKNLVDCIGGVYIDVEKDMFYEDRWGNLRVDLKKGRQLLNGEQLIGYIRFRMDEEGDIGRIRRQNQAIIEIMQQLPNKVSKDNIMKILSDVLPYIQTDLDKEKILLLFELSKISNLKYRSYKLPIRTLDIEGVSYVELEKHSDVVKGWYKGYDKLAIVNACRVDNTYQIYDKYIAGSKYILNSSTYLDSYLPFSIVLSKNGDNPLYYRIPFGKAMSVKDFIYNRYVDSSSQIYSANRDIYQSEIREIRKLIYDNDVILILGDDSIDK